MYALVARPGPRVARRGLFGFLGTLGDVVSDLAGAIARYEGFYSPNSVAARNNNPGNLRGGIGATGVDANGYAVFPDLATGWAALQNQVSINISRGLTLNEFFGGKPGVYPGYAPSSDANNPAKYASTVASWLGISSTVPLSQYLGSSPAAGAGDVTGGGDFTAALEAALAPASAFPLSLSPTGAFVGVVGAIALFLLVVD